MSQSFSELTIRVGTCNLGKSSMRLYFSASRKNKLSKTGKRLFAKPYGKYQKCMNGARNQYFFFIASSTKERGVFMRIRPAIFSENCFVTCTLGIHHILLPNRSTLLFCFKTSFLSESTALVRVNDSAFLTSSQCPGKSKLCGIHHKPLK